MIEILTEKDKHAVEKVCTANNIEYNSTIEMIKCTDKGDLLGFSLVSFDKSATVLFVGECETVIFDGLIRTAVHLASEKLIGTVYYAQTVDENVLLKLGFVQDKAKRIIKPLSFMEKQCEKM